MEEEKVTKRSVRIKVIGVGGGGNNAVTSIIKDRVKNVETYLFNTETKILQKAATKNVLQIGKETTKGLGAGANEEIGEKSALESKEEIKHILQDTDMLFLTAGMGGGTGTGAIPVVAEIAKSMNILTVAIVTKPFAFEGKRRSMRAEIGIEKLKDTVDALIVVLNDKLLQVIGDRTSMQEAFKLTDNVLKQGIQSITDLLTTVGDINLDFADVKTIFQYKGKAYMGLGRASGDNRVVEAVKQAIDNPITEYKIDNAKGVIFNVTGGKSLGLNEINNAIKIINDRIDTNANIMFGTVTNEELKDEVKVTVIATGIE